MNNKLINYYGKVISFGLPITIFLVAIMFYLRTYDSCQIKITIFQMGAAIVITSWLMKYLELGRFPWTRSSLLVILPALLFLLSGIVSHVFFSPFKATSLEELIRRILYVGTFLVIYSEMNDFLTFRRLILWMSLAGILSALYGLIQHFGMDPFIWKGAFGNRIFSTFGNPNFFSAYLVLLSPLMLVQVNVNDLKETKKAVLGLFTVSAAAVLYCVTQLIPKETYEKLGGMGAFAFSFIVGNNVVAFSLFTLLCIGIFVYIKLKNKIAFLSFYCVFINIILTNSKASYIGVAAAICAFTILSAFFLSNVDKKTRNKFLLFFISAIVIFTSIGVLYLTSKRIDSIRFRIFTWLSTKQMIDEHPIRGTGIGTFKITYPSVRREEIFHIEGKHNTETDHPENEHIEIWYDEGIIGYGIFVWMITVLFVLGIRKLVWDADKNKIEHRYLIGILAGITGMLFHNMMCVNMRFVSSGFSFWIMLGLTASYFSGQYKGPVNKQKKIVIPISLRRAGQAALGFLLIFVFLPYFYRLFMADIYHNIAIAYSKAAQWENAIVNYNKVIQNNADYTMTHYFLGNVYNDRWDMNKKYNVNWGDKDFQPRDDAERALSKYADVKKLSPNYVQVHFQEGSVYEKLGMWDKAIENYKKAVKIDPVYAPTYFKMGWCYVQEKQWDKAEEVYSKAITWNPNFVQAYVNLANVYYMEEKFELAYQTYKKAYEFDPSDEKLKGIVYKLEAARNLKK